MDDSSHDRLIQEFCDLTGATPAAAQQFLAANRWDLSSAATEFYTSQEENAEEAEEEPYTGPRTLDGRPAPQSAMPSAASSSSSRNPPRRGIATLGSYNQGDSGHGGHDDDDDDDSDFEDDPRKQPRDLFAGGEKSGLAVQDPPRRNDPRSLVDDILKKARANTPRQGPEASSAAPSRFRGSGQTLGGDGAPSRVIPGATPSVPDPGPTQTRVLHLWEDGFSVEDGPLHRFDDPRNAADLQMIRQGRAPLHLMNVRPDQPVDVQLNKHDENYKPPPKVYKPFSGHGHRLGSPTPGPGPSTAPPPTTAAPSQASGPPTVDVDSSQPVISIRLQLGDGTRLPVRFNTTHTIGDVYDFISRAYPGGNDRPWVLATTFPNKDHTDKSLVLGDVPEFKRGGTAVQKWA
ncbi:hypothetical protein F5884DRAFT_457805 [Xylogone sp. PMI_703]|nr:hypothetical protein F5884DRAFT_457805 [Xylogone sp. PMI_703]